MRWGAKLRELFFPRQERDDPELAGEVERLSVVGLRVIAGVCFAVPSLVLLVGWIWLPQFLDGTAYSLLVALLGALALGLSFWTPARGYSRLLGVLVGYVVSFMQALPILSTDSMASGASHHHFGNVTFVLLVGITALPVLPIHTLALGGAMVASYVALAVRLGATEALSGSGLMMVVMMSIVAIMCTGLTAVVYRQRAAAFEAMNGTGAIEVTSSTRNGEIVIEVQDDGRGMPPEQWKHLFDPAFRVEGSRVATTNWGLFVSRSIVAEHGGQIEIESEPGRGMTVRIVLPTHA